MSFQSDQFKAEIEMHRQAQAYYASIRQPGLERVTFTLALSGSLALAGRTLGLWLLDYGLLTFIFFLTALAAYLSLDTVLAKAQRPGHLTSAALSPGSLYEKFSMQGRSWHLLAVLMPPFVAKLIAACLNYGTVPR